jgi:two-component system phosphate regulon sensor histidine kinase PhoR
VTRLRRRMAASRPGRPEDAARESTTDLAGLVSHELRTPLAVIVGNLEVLMDGDAGPLSPAQRRLLDSLERNAHRLLGAVGDVLLLMAPPVGRLAHRRLGRGPLAMEGRLRRRMVVLQEIVERALRVAAAYHPAGVAQLRADVPAAPVRVYGDEDELTRLVVNLVAVPGFAEVDLVLRAGTGQARLMVTLTPGGGGYVAEDRALRLAVATRIARRHGGVLTVCDGAGGATAVTVLLPLLGTTGSSWRNAR